MVYITKHNEPKPIIFKYRPLFAIDDAYSYRCRRIGHENAAIDGKHTEMLD